MTAGEGWLIFLIWASASVFYMIGYSDGWMRGRWKAITEPETEPEQCTCRNPFAHDECTDLPGCKIEQVLRPRGAKGESYE